MSTERNLPNAAAVMQREVIVFTPGEEVASALQTLLVRRISGGPVVDGGRVVGMFSERDGLTVLAASAYESEPAGTVGQHMRRQFTCVRPDTDLFTLANLFQKQPIRRLPVVDDAGLLLGLVLRGDVIAALQRLLDERSAVRTEPRTPYERVAEHLA